MSTLGIEREWFIFRDGRIVPEIGRLLPEVWRTAKENGFSENQFTFELFAGQIEDRTKISSSIEELTGSLNENARFLRRVGKTLGLEIACRDYVSEDELGELMVNPFNERHRKIWEKISKERKVAASQVAAIHVHVGVTTEKALKVLNSCRKEIIDELVEIGNFSNGRRIQAYRTMAECYGDSPIFKDFSELEKYIESRGGERNVWDLVRYKPSTGTIEFRMFGATENELKIIEFVTACQKILERA